MEHSLYVTLLLILVHNTPDCFGHSEMIENSCCWQKQGGLVSTRLPEEKVSYAFAVGRGRHYASYTLKEYASSVRISFDYWIKHGNVSTAIESEESQLRNVEPEEWFSHVETFNNVTALTQILIIAHLDDEGVFAMTELLIKTRNNNNTTEILCASSDQCDVWRYQGLQKNIYHPYFVLGNGIKVESFTTTVGRHIALNLTSEKQTEQELRFTYYINGGVDKKAELVVFYKAMNDEPIELWKDETLEPAWKTLRFSTDSHIRPNDNYSIFIEANSDEDTVIALSSLDCKQKESSPSLKYAYKVETARDFLKAGWSMERDAKWRHNDTNDEWYLCLSSEDKQAIFRSWWIVPKKENFVRMKHRKRGRGETKIAIYLRNENNQKRILKRLIIVNSQWETLTIPFSMGRDFYISIKATVNGEDTQLHLTQLSVNDPCHPDPCLEGKCVVNNDTDFECECDFGYTGSTCELTDWCSSYYRNVTGYEFCLQRNASCTNVIDADTFTCVCQEKLQYFNLDEGCTDLDLCGLKQCDEHAFCENNTCYCKDHYESETMEDKVVCKPINYCQKNVCGEAKCIAGNAEHPENYKCYCDPGFVYRDKKCKNNLCNFPSLNQCEQQCLVIDDHYRCSCYNGFDLVNNSTCAIAEGWQLCHNIQCENGICLTNLSTNDTSCVCNKGYVYQEGKCIDYCSFHNGTLAKSFCPSGKCIGDPEHLFRCVCEEEYEFSNNGVTCILKNTSLENEEERTSCRKNTCETCPPGTEENQNKTCTSIVKMRKYKAKCLLQNARIDTDLESKPICICPPFMSFVDGKCSISPFTYFGTLAVTKKFLVKDRSGSYLPYLRNLIHESMYQIFEKSGTELDYRASAILDCVEKETDFICKVALFFNKEVGRKVNLVRNAAICIADTEYCIIPPKLVISRYKLRTIIFGRTDFCRDVSRYYCSEQTYCQNNVVPETGFTCKCRSGYQLYNVYYPDNSMEVVIEQCKDIDECQENNPCPKNSNCINTMGSYQCQCKDEFRPKYREKHAKIECMPVCDPNPCEHGECIKLPGGFKCRCDAGFTGVLCDEEDINFKHLYDNLIMTGAVLGGALLLTFIITYAIRMRAKKKLEKKSTQIIQMRGISNEGFAD